MDRGHVTRVRSTLGRSPACGTRSAKRRNPNADRDARYRAPSAVHRSRCRTWVWRPRRVRDDLRGARFVRARINNLFDEEDKLAYACNTPERDAGAVPGRQR
ncbi:hypothetical protein WI69_04805 [Burkholderia diffusa]|nr:hypothetical protein WI28_24530 [Burkholderia diffusa]KVC22713.1 hypothetical protein WI69_04805 [Burkholderia diffusa]KVH42430.1 hypothetical protein WJ39_30020 [Burkholderia diffusa]